MKCVYTQVGGNYNDDLINDNKYMYAVIPVSVGFVFGFFISKLHAVSKLCKFNIKTPKTNVCFAYVVNRKKFNAKISRITIETFANECEIFANKCGTFANKRVNFAN